MKPLLITALAALFLMACDTTAPRLTGAPAVTATIDGVSFRSTETDTQLVAGLNPADDRMGMQASTAGQARFDQIGFSLKPFRGTGQYPLQITTSLTATAYWFPDSRNSTTPPVYNGFGGPHDYVYVTRYDRAHHIVEGVFGFDAIDYVTGAVKHVRNGHFRGALAPPQPLP